MQKIEREFIIFAHLLAAVAGSSAFAKSTEHAATRFLDACMISAQVDDPLGAEARHEAYCRCRLDALAAEHSSEKIEQIAAYIEETNGGVQSADERIGDASETDLGANEAAATACQAKLSDQ